MKDTAMTIEEFEKFSPSELVKLALRDLEAVEQNPLYSINMYLYHTKIHKNNKCQVCFAGSILANSLRISVDEKMPHFHEIKSKFPEKTAYLLVGLDSFRQDDIRGFAEAFGGYTQIVIMEAYENNEFPELTSDDDYDANPDNFKTWVKKMITVLEELGI